MKRYIPLAVMVILLGWGRSKAQVPPSFPIAPPPVPGPAVPAPAPCCQKSPGKFWGCCDQRVKTCLCPAGLCQWVKGVFTPVCLGKGGCQGPCCSRPPTAADLGQMTPDNTSMVEAAAAKIRFSEAGACARRAAVRYLGTVNCHYYPEAEEALLAALRCDANECVRLEAAMALANGCCCSQKVIEKLNIVLSGSESDGSPAETSERVRAAAHAALQKCLAAQAGCFMPSQPLEAPAPFHAPPPRELPRAPASHSENVLELAGLTVPPPLPTAMDQAMMDAQRTLAERVGTLPPARPAVNHRNLLDIVRQAAKPADTATSGLELTPPPPAPPRTSGPATLGLAPIGRIPPRLPTDE